MATYRADLHIHSRFSRATSSRLTLPHLAAWAGAKGIAVLGTGDFTHPVWRDELRAALILDEASGLYRLRSPLTEEALAAEIPALAGMRLAEPRFMLQAEISSIYKKDGAVRKVHNLVYMPDFDAADRLCARLERVGNLASDGRPILGLDSRHLLEMVLDIPRACLIPAHIWTPWFSLFGSRSGFNSLEECFGDLSPHIFALETGLSSDPDMNRCWSHLDRLKMVSNSDAHSGENLGREATRFIGEPSYDGIFNALRGSAPGYAGTLEFFPEEGKYHLDGHRACGVVLEPEESRRLNDICPVCGKPLTVGVLHRVLELADRAAPPEPGADFASLVPLPEILGELLHCGPKTKKPQLKLAELTRRFGTELDLLLDAPLADVGRHWPELGEALRRMRAGQVIRSGGYDGEYGVIRLFDKNEMGLSLLDKVPQARKSPVRKNGKDAPLLASAPFSAPVPGATEKAAESGPAPEQTAFTPAQTAALEAGPEPALVLAGPGSGKTRTLVGRLARLLEQGVSPADMAAVTFTRRAAQELRERLAATLPTGVSGDLPEADTLHALALKHWDGPKPVVLGEEAARRAFAEANPSLSAKEARAGWDALSLGRERMAVPLEWTAAAAAYTLWKRARGFADYGDLPESWLSALRAGAARPWKHVLVDEAQDLSPLQRSLIRALLPENGEGFFGIGDPDQSIYGFRGADADLERLLRDIWPGLNVFDLGESHRVPPAILHAACAVLGPNTGRAPLKASRARAATLQWLQAPTAELEAAWVAERIAYLVGGTSHSQADARTDLAGCHLAGGSCSPGDMAVLVRLKSLMPLFKAALERRGIPCAMPETEAFWADRRVETLLEGAAAFVGGTLEQAMPEELRHVGADAWHAGPAAVLAVLEREGTAFDPLFGKSSAFRALEEEFRQAENLWRGTLDAVALRRELDLVRSRAEQVQIMTLHAAKGLEFKAVFLPCLDDGLVPFRGMEALLGQTGGAFLTDEQEAEERRLLYVGLTRASEAVFASSAERRSLYGHSLRLVPSPFLPLSLFRAVVWKRKTKISASQLSF